MGLIVVTELDFSEKMYVKCLAQYVAESKCSILRSAIIMSSGEIGKGGGWMLLTPIQPHPLELGPNPLACSEPFLKLQFPI